MKSKKTKKQGEFVLKNIKEIDENQMKLIKGGSEVLHDTSLAVIRKIG